MLSSPRPNIPRNKIVTVFGSSRPREGEPDYEEAHSLGRALADAGFSVAHGSMVNVSIPGQLDLLAEQVIPAAEKF